MNKYVICGETVPEGRLVCGKCEAGNGGASKAPPPTEKDVTDRKENDDG